MQNKSSWLKDTINEHPQPLKLTWGWLSENANNLTPEDFWDKFSRYPMITILKSKNVTPDAESSNFSLIDTSTIHRIVVARSEEPELNMVYAEVGGEEHEIFGAFAGNCGGLGLFHQSAEGEISVSDDYYDFFQQAQLSEEDLGKAFHRLEGLRAEFEDYSEDEIEPDVEDMLKEDNKKQGYLHAK